MLRVVIRKMLNNKWMVLSLLIGNILLIAMVSSIPVYSDAILQRVLTKELEQYQLDNGEYSGSMNFEYNSFSIKEEYRQSEALRLDSLIKNDLIEKYNVKTTVQKRTTFYSGVSGLPLDQREEEPMKRSFRLTSMTDLENNIQLVKGEMYSKEFKDGIIEVIVTEKTMEKIDILLGEVFEITNFTTGSGENFKVKIVGIFKENDNNALYWNTAPSEYSRNIFMDEALFEQLFLDSRIKNSVNVEWYTALDHTDIKIDKIDNIVALTKEYQYYFKDYGNCTMEVNFMDILETYSSKAEKLTVTLWVLQVPIFIVLAFFIFMVSKLIVESEKNEIAVMKSRGASRFQIFRLFFIQTVIILAMSLAVAPQLGLFICKILGASNGFMELVQRTALEIKMSTTAYIYSFIAAALSAVTMLIPVINYSRITIVKHKQSKSRKNSKALWQKFFLDFVALGISLYGLYNYNNQKEYLASAAGEASLDPLLFLSSTLFIMGVGLLCLRFFPLFIKILFTLGKKLWSPSLYASFIKVGRSAGDEQFIMLFLILTLSLGIFSAKSARSINLNTEEKLKYEIGTDIVFKEKWETVQQIEYTDVDGETSENVTAEEYKEPDFNRFTNLEEPEQVTKVFKASNLEGNVLKGERFSDVNVMGIITDEFGKAAWFRNDLEPIHWYNYLNEIAEVSNGALISRGFAEKNDIRVGDTIRLRYSGSWAELVVCDFIDYWPTYSPKKEVETENETVQIDNTLVVANLTYLQSVWGVKPYEVWIKTKDGNTDFIYEYIEENDIEISEFRDLYSDIITNKNDPVFQGTNGVLTVGFIITLVVCMTGFLIYWILSIKARVLQFGIFRAMGMTMTSVLGMLVNEQILISAVAVGLGIVIGEIASELFVPLIQLGYSTSDQVLPLKVVIETNDYVRLFSIVGIMIFVCMIILSVIISKIKIAQALKLGED